MKQKKTAALIGVLALVLGLVSCTPTDVAVQLCEDQGAGAMVYPPGGNPAPRYRPNKNLPVNSSVDARGIDWVVPMAGTPVNLAVMVGHKTDPASTGSCFIGGAIRHTLPHDTTTWSQWHDVDSPFALTAPSSHVIGTRIFNVGDGIAIAGPGSDWGLHGVHIRQAHDDCVQNDNLHSGVIQDSFLDGCYVGFSAQRTKSSNRDGTGNTVQILGSLIRMQPMPHPYQPSWNPNNFTTPGHSALFKMPAGPMNGGDPSRTPGRAPSLEIRDTVIVMEQYPNIRRSNPSVYDAKLIPDYDPDGAGPLPRESYLAAEDCSNNTLVWLGEGEPVFNPALPSCFTVLTGQTARDFWATKRADWLATHPLAWQPDTNPEVFTYDELAP